MQSFISRDARWCMGERSEAATRQCLSELHHAVESLLAVAETLNHFGIHRYSQDQTFVEPVSNSVSNIRFITHFLSGGRQIRGFNSSKYFCPLLYRHSREPCECYDRAQTWDSDVCNSFINHNNVWVFGQSFASLLHVFQFCINSYIMLYR